MEENGVGAQKKRPYQNRIMTLDYQGETYHIWFRREIYDLAGIKRRDIKPGTPLGYTIAHIGVLDHKDTNGLPVYRIVSIGKSVCVAPDQFVKETGRLIALRRALDDGHHKEFKRIVFNSYLGRRNVEA